MDSIRVCSRAPFGSTGFFLRRESVCLPKVPSVCFCVDHLSFCRCQKEMGSALAAAAFHPGVILRHSILFMVRKCLVDRRRKVLRFTVHQRKLCALLRSWRRWNRPSEADLLLHYLSIYVRSNADAAVAVCSFDYFRSKNFKDDRDLFWGFGSLRYLSFLSIRRQETSLHSAVVSAIGVIDSGWDP